MQGKLKFILPFFLLIIPVLFYGQSEMKFIRGNRAKIQFQLINNLILIPAKLNGVKLTLLLDTGEDKTLIFGNEVEDLKLKNSHKVKFTGIGENSDIEGLKSHGNVLTLGDALQFKNKTCYVILDSLINFSTFLGVPIHGIIGYEVFKSHPVYINYSQRTMYVYSNYKKFDRKRRNAVELDFSLERNKPFLTTDISINGKPEQAKLLLDIGNSNPFYLYEDFARGKYSDNYIKTFLGQGFGGEIYGIRSRLRSVKIADFTFDYPVISVPFNEIYAHTQIHLTRSGSIGGEIFRRFKVFFDYPHQKLYLKKGRAYNAPFHVNMSGLEIIHQSMEWEVEKTISMNLNRDRKEMDPHLKDVFKYSFQLVPSYFVIAVRKNSPADLAGLRPGDKIIRMNKKKASKYTLNDLNSLLSSTEGKKIDLLILREDEKLEFTFRLEDPIPYKKEKR